MKLLFQLCENGWRNWAIEIKCSEQGSWLGKVKTTSQMIALIGLLWRYNPTMEIIATIALYVAVILTVWSMWQYLTLAKESLLQE